MNDKPTKDEGAQAYAQTGHSELVEELHAEADYRGQGVRVGSDKGEHAEAAHLEELLNRAAAALTAQAAEIERLREALTAERERCAKIAEEHPWPTQTTEALWPIERTVIAAAIRGGSDASD